MTSHPETLAESADVALRTFKTFEEGRPELIPIGIPPFDDEIGGLFPGTLGILAMRTGVGKSRLKLAAALHNAQVNKVPTGLIELEDPEDVVGCRSLAWASGVNSLRIRRKDLGPEELAALEHGREVLSGLSPFISLRYNIGAPIAEVIDAIRDLAEAGCKIVWIDYIGKIRDPSSGDRRNEVSYNFGQIQRACSKHGVVGMVISQVRRTGDARGPINHHLLKESGDLENEARLIILGDVDERDPDIVNVRVSKSTYGGVGKFCSYITDKSGNLALMPSDHKSAEPSEDYEDI